MASSKAVHNNDMGAAIGEACRQRPHLASILESMAALLKAEEEAQASMPAPAKIPVDPGRLAQGAPVLAGIRLDFLERNLRHAAGHVLPAAAQCFSNADFLAETADPKVWNGRLLATAARQYLDGDAHGLARQAGDWRLEPAALAFVLEMILRPVLHQLAQQMGNSVPTAVWKRGQCPLCGQAPAMSYLSKPTEEGDEFLRGGGGQRMLSCGLCGFEWRVARTVCASCGSEESKDKECIRPLDNPGERIDACKTCGAYCPGLDLREFQHRPHWRLAPLTCIHLDMLAQEKGYHPIAWSAWNTFDQEAGA